MVLNFQKQPISKKGNSLLLTKQKETHRLGERIYGCWGREMGGRDTWGVWDGHGHIAMFKMDSREGPTMEHEETCSMLCGRLDGRRVWGRMDTCICTAEFLRCSPETVRTLLIDHTPKQNKKV